MQESTQPTPATDTPTAYGYCAWHRGPAEGVRVISVIEQGSGPGHVLFACGPCREAHRLVPFADRP